MNRLIKIILVVFGTIGLITTGSLAGSLFTVLIQHYFERNKLKTERESLLAREIYFKLQDKAEKIRFGMHLLSLRMDKITLEIKLKVEILSVSEAGKTGKKIKAVPNKPGILIE